MKETGLRRSPITKLHLEEMSRRRKSIEINAPWSPEAGRKCIWRTTINGYEVSTGTDENVVILGHEVRYTSL